MLKAWNQFFLVTYLLSKNVDLTENVDFPVRNRDRVL